MPGRRSPARPAAAASDADRSRRRSFRRSAGVERRHRQEGVDAQLREEPELGIDARHRRRPGVQRRHQRSQDPRVRRGHAASCCGSFRPRSGILAPPTSFLDRRQTVHRRALRLGRRFGRGCRRRSTGSSRASIRRCRKAARCGCSRSSEISNVAFSRNAVSTRIEARRGFSIITKCPVPAASRAAGTVWQRRRHRGRLSLDGAIPKR